VVCFPFFLTAGCEAWNGHASPGFAGGVFAAFCCVQAEPAEGLTGPEPKLQPAVPCPSPPFPTMFCSRAEVWNVRRDQESGWFAMVCGQWQHAPGPRPGLVQGRGPARGGFPRPSWPSRARCCRWALCAGTWLCCCLVAPNLAKRQPAAGRSIRAGRADRAEPNGRSAGNEIGAADAHRHQPRCWQFAGWPVVLRVRGLRAGLFLPTALASPRASMRRSGPARQWLVQPGPAAVGLKAGLEQERHRLPGGCNGGAAQDSPVLADWGFGSQPLPAGLGIIRSVPCMVSRLIRQPITNAR